MLNTKKFNKDENHCLCSSGDEFCFFFYSFCFTRFEASVILIWPIVSDHFYYVPLYVWLWGHIYFNFVRCALPMVGDFSISCDFYQFPRFICFIVETRIIGFNSWPFENRTWWPLQNSRRLQSTNIECENTRCRRLYMPDWWSGDSRSSAYCWNFR